MNTGDQRVLISIAGSDHAERMVCLFKSFTKTGLVLNQSCLWVMPTSLSYTDTQLSRDHLRVDECSILQLYHSCLTGVLAPSECDRSLECFEVHSRADASSSLSKSDLDIPAP